MPRSQTTWWRALATALAALGVATSAVLARATSPPDALRYVKSGLVQVDVFDRFDGTALPVHQKDGRHYVVGVPGHEYAVRIRNCTAGRILVVTSVDGANVISGETASTAQSGYVLDPWGSVEITGWRKSMERTAAFYFTDLGDSYAARTGRPQNVGVIGVAVYEERQQRIAYREHDRRGRVATPEAPSSPGNAERQDAPTTAVPSNVPAPAREAAESVAPPEYKDESQKMSKLGTGHGRGEDSRVTLTRFERATALPAEIVAIRYDRRENLVAMGVLPQPTPRIARREPNPFPSPLRFAPDPPR